MRQRIIDVKSFLTVWFQQHLFEPIDTNELNLRLIVRFEFPVFVNRYYMDENTQSFSITIDQDFNPPTIIHMAISNDTVRYNQKETIIKKFKYGK